MQLEFLQFTIRNTNSWSGKDQENYIYTHTHTYVTVTVYLHVLRKQAEAFYSCRFRVKKNIQIREKETTDSILLNMQNMSGGKIQLKKQARFFIGQGN